MVHKSEDAVDDVLNVQDNNIHPIKIVYNRRWDDGEGNGIVW